MPVDRGIAEDLATTIRDLYASLETVLAATIAKTIGRDPNPDDVAKLAAATRMRRNAETLLNQLDGEARDEALAAVTIAYARGARAGLAELAAVHDRSDQQWWERRGWLLEALARLIGVAQRKTRHRRDRLTRELAALRDQLPGVDAIQVIAHKLTSTLAATRLPVLRWVDDAYRRVIAETSSHTVAGAATRLEAGQAAWQRLLDQGITGFTDRAGRSWRLASYTEMATRTATGQAAVEAHMDRLAEAGRDLVIVSDAPGECALCRPFEGKLLALSGLSGLPGPRSVENVMTGRTSMVDVVDTVPGAIARGLMHPNCRHSISAYFHGATSVPRHTADPAGNAARTRLRELERNVRAWRRRHAGALTEKARTEAAAKVEHWQAEIDRHTAATGLLRQRHREQITGHEKETARAQALRDKPPPPPRPAPEPAPPEPPAPAPPPEPAPAPEPARWDIPTDGLRVTDMFIPDDYNADRRDYQRLKTAANRWLAGKDFGDFTPEVLTLSVYADRVEWHGEIRDADGIRAGVFQRDFHRDRYDKIVWVEHAYLKLSPRYQGQGFAKRFNNALYDWYRVIMVG